MSWRDRAPRFFFGSQPEKEDQSWYDTMQVCENGHQITSMAVSHPEYQKKRGPTCGAVTLIACPKCGTPIPGYHHMPGFAYVDSDPPPSFCQNCGEPYPWNGKENTEADEDASSQPGTGACPAPRCRDGHY